MGAIVVAPPDPPALDLKGSDMPARINSCNDRRKFWVGCNFGNFDATWGALGGKFHSKDTRRENRILLHNTVHLRKVAY
jgi:hypothetical protein